MAINKIILSGCSPTPLSSYLKALGVLRLIASSESNVTGTAADLEARCFWKNERFHLCTRLNQEELMRFFLQDYAPSPLIGAWNGRAGFLEDEDSKRKGPTIIRGYEQSSAERFANLKKTIALLRKEPLLALYRKLRDEAKILKKEGQNEEDLEKKKVLKKEAAQVEKRAAQVKKSLLPSLRGKTDSGHLSLIDAAVVLGEENRMAPLLGSGFNDGSRDFGVNFLEKISNLFHFEDGKPTELSAPGLEISLFNLPGIIEKADTMGHFSPGQGGANATTGYEGKNPLNSWDVIFFLEGSLLWSGALTCRWGTQSTERAAFPFTFEPNLAGSGSLSNEDPNSPRGELWAPFWSKPCSLIEIESLFAEGRITLGSKIARTGLDAARSISRLGISRGIAAFERYSMIQPDSKMPYQATPLGRFKTPKNSRNDLISDLDAGGWLNRICQLARGKGAPGSARSTVKQLEDALFSMSSESPVNPRSVQGVLGTLGDLVTWLRNSRDGVEKITPPPRLSYKWVRKADDQTPEYRVAAALASLGHPNIQDPSDADFAAKPQKPIALAAHFAPIIAETVHKRIRRWDIPNQTRIVWGSGSLESNLIEILHRRLLDGSPTPLEAAAPAQLADISAFLEGNFDQRRCKRMLAGLVWAQPSWLPPAMYPFRPIVPFAYAALKPIFSPANSLKKLMEKGLISSNCHLPIPTPPGLITRLQSGRVEESVRLALYRGRASGIVSPFIYPEIPRSTKTGRRLAAAMLIPINDYGLQSILNQAYPAESQKVDVI